MQNLDNKNNDINVVIAMCSVFVLLGRIQEVIPFLAHLRLGAVVSLIMIMLVIKAFLNNEINANVLNSVETKSFICLVLLSGISTVFSVYKGLSLQFFTGTMLLTACFFLFIASSVRSINEIKRIIWAYVWVIIILAVPSLFASYGARWKALGATYDQNDTALFMVVSIPIIVGFMSVNSGLKRLILGFGGLSALVAIVQSQSRGGFLGLVTVLAIMLFRSRKINLFQKAGIVVLLMLAFQFMAPEGFRERIATIGKEDYNTTDTFGRKQIWERGVKLMLKSPILGVGPSCFEVANAYAYESEVGGVAWRCTAHNSFLLIGVEMGMTGVFLYCLMLLSGMWQAHRIQNLGAVHPYLDEHLWLARALEASIAGFMVNGFFISFCYHPLTYFLVALGVAYRNVILSMIDSPSEGQDISLTINNDTYR